MIPARDEPRSGENWSQEEDAELHDEIRAIAAKHGRSVAAITTRVARLETRWFIEMKRKRQEEAQR